MQYPLEGLQATLLDLTSVGGHRGKTGIVWWKEQRLRLHGCVAYVTSLSKQGGSAKTSDFVVIRIRASCTMPNHPTDREVNSFSIYLSSCQKTTCRL